jgi:hypothetical protein
MTQDELQPQTWLAVLADTCRELRMRVCIVVPAVLCAAVLAGFREKREPVVPVGLYRMVGGTSSV